MRPFRLLHLPILQLKRVIFLMDNCQRIKLAICSEVAEEAMRPMNIRTHSIAVYLAEEFYLDVRTTLKPLNNLRIYFHRISEPVKREGKPEKIDKRVLSSCYLAGNDKEMHFELAGMSIKFDTVDLVKWMADMFPLAKIGWIVSLRTFGSDVLERLFQVPHFNRAYFLKTMKGELTSDIFTEFTEKIKCLEHIYIYSKVPPKFSDMKALSYNRVHFEDARWMKAEHLMLMKSPFHLSVGQTMFDTSDLNRYLKYWKSTSDNVKGRISLPLKSGVQINWDAIIQGVFLNLNSECIILCDNDSEREHALGILFFQENIARIVFATCEKQRDPFVYETLVLLRHLSGLRKRIKEVNNQMGRWFFTSRNRQLEETRNELEEQLVAGMYELHEAIRKYSLKFQG